MDILIRVGKKVTKDTFSISGFTLVAKLDSKAGLGGILQGEGTSSCSTCHVLKRREYKTASWNHQHPCG